MGGGPCTALPRLPRPIALPGLPQAGAWLETQGRERPRVCLFRGHMGRCVGEADSRPRPSPPGNRARG